MSDTYLWGTARFLRLLFMSASPGWPGPGGKAPSRLRVGTGILNDYLSTFLATLFFQLSRMHKNALELKLNTNASAPLPVNIDNVFI